MCAGLVRSEHSATLKVPVCCVIRVCVCVGLCSHLQFAPAAFVVGMICNCLLCLFGRIGAEGGAIEPRAPDDGAAAGVGGHELGVGGPRSSIGGPGAGGAAAERGVGPVQPRPADRFAATQPHGGCVVVQSGCGALQRLRGAGGREEVPDEAAEGARRGQREQADADAGDAGAAGLLVPPPPSPRPVPMPIPVSALCPPPPPSATALPISPCSCPPSCPRPRPHPLSLCLPSLCPTPSDPARFYCSVPGLTQDDAERLRLLEGLLQAKEEQLEVLQEVGEARQQQLDELKTVKAQALKTLMDAVVLPGPQRGQRDPAADALDGRRVGSATAPLLAPEVPVGVGNNAEVVLVQQRALELVFAELVRYSASTVSMSPDTKQVCDEMDGLLTRLKEAVEAAPERWSPPTQRHRGIQVDACDGPAPEPKGQRAPSPVVRARAMLDNRERRALEQVCALCTSAFSLFLS